jgi:alanine or glycine:cation symporter, AGCS family
MPDSSLADAINAAADFVFGPWTLALFFGCGIFLTIRYRCVQLTHLGRAVRAAFRPASGEGGALSPFQSFATALGASIGTGNIAGVATAIKFTEATLGAMYREGDAKTLSCGPTLYLTKGLGMPRVGWLYAVLAGLAALLSTPIAQTNSVANALNDAFGYEKAHVGYALAVLAAVVVLGGVKGVGRASQALSPLKIIVYLGGGAVVLFHFRERLPDVFASIFREAFSLESAGGGALGVAMMQAMRYGMARGIYANEAGYGSAAIAYGAAQSTKPAEHGLAAIIEVYVVSFLTSSVSGLCVLASGALAEGKESVAAVGFGFEEAMPGFGGALVAICALLFGYTTLIGWCFIGEQILMAVLGRKIALPFRIIYCALIAIGADTDVTTAWAFGDFMNCLQIFPNLIGVIGLSGLVAKELRKQ